MVGLELSMYGTYSMYLKECVYRLPVGVTLTLVRTREVDAGIQRYEADAVLFAHHTA